LALGDPHDPQCAGPALDVALEQKRGPQTQGGRGMRRAVSALLAVGLLTVMTYSGTRFWALDKEIKSEEDLHRQVLQQKPAPENGPGESPLTALQAQNPDIVGWISVPYTNIDYPIVQAKDNDYYLRRDLNGDFAQAGTVFMDCRCAKDGDGYSIIYGHNMKSGSMFGTLKRFEEESFFNSHPEGRILLENGWYYIEFFAFLIVSHNDAIVYGQPQAPDLMTYLARQAKHYRPSILAAEDRLVALSTCSYVFEGARMVLLGKIKYVQ